MDRPSLEKALSTYEQVSNYAGIVIFVSSVSGVIRMAVGIIEMLAGLYNHDWNIVMHGVANISRGSIETTWLISVIFSYLYDGYLERRLRYQHEIQLPVVWKLCCTSRASIE